MEAGEWWRIGVVLKSIGTLSCAEADGAGAEYERAVEDCIGAAVVGANEVDAVDVGVGLRAEVRKSCRAALREHAMVFPFFFFS